jgi:hypothetical protein
MLAALPGAAGERLTIMGCKARQAMLCIGMEK